MKILSIGDIHGLDLWKNMTHKSTHDFMIWKNAVETGVPAEAEIWKELPFMDLDKIIFVGDYVDSFDLTNEVIIENLKDIIYFRKALPDKVVTLLGNHDIQYLIPNQFSSGFRSEMSIDLKELFHENREIFKIAHLEKGGKLKNVNWLWTHAGVTSGWYHQAKQYLLQPDRFHQINRQYVTKPLDEMINWLWQSNASILYSVDRSSRGIAKWAGPLWVRPDMLNKNHLQGHGDFSKAYNQVVGHTNTDDFNTWEWVESGEKYYIHYIDCLPSKKEGLIFKI